MRRVNIDRMRRYRERTRRRRVWTREERRELLAAMNASVDRMRAEDGLPPLAPSRAPLGGVVASEAGAATHQHKKAPPAGRSQRGAHNVQGGD